MRLAVWLGVWTLLFAFLLQLASSRNCTAFVAGTNYPYIQFCDTDCSSFTRNLPFGLVQALFQDTVKDGFVNAKREFYSSFDNSIVVAGNFLKRISFSMGVKIFDTNPQTGYIAKYSLTDSQNTIEWAMLLGYFVEFGDIAILPNGWIGVLSSFEGNLELYENPSQVTKRSVVSYGEQRDGIFSMYDADGTLQMYVHFLSPRSIIVVSCETSSNDSFILTGRFSEWIQVASSPSQILTGESSTELMSFVAVVHAPSQQVTLFFKMTNALVRFATHVQDQIVISTIISGTNSIVIAEQDIGAFPTQSSLVVSLKTSNDTTVEWVQSFSNLLPSFHLHSMQRNAIIIAQNSKNYALDSSGIVYLNSTSGQVLEIQQFDNSTNIVFEGIAEDASGNIIAVASLKTAQYPNSIHLAIVQSTFGSGLSLLKSTKGSSVYEPNSISIDRLGVVWVSFSIVGQLLIEEDLQEERYNYKTGILMGLRNGCNCNIDICREPVCYSYKASSINSCSGRGVCTSQGTCSCASGASGAYCERTECYGLSSLDPSVCSSNGICNVDGTCSCLSGYTGHTCALATCTRSCGYGECSDEDSQCDCSKYQNFNTLIVGQQCQFKYDRTDIFFVEDKWNRNNVLSSAVSMDYSTIQSRYLLQNRVEKVKMDRRNQRSILVLPNSSLVVFPWNASNVTLLNSVFVSPTSHVCCVEFIENSQFIVAYNDLQAQDDRKAFLILYNELLQEQVMLTFSSLQSVLIEFLFRRRDNYVIIGGSYHGRFTALTCVAPFTSIKSAFVMIYNVNSKNCSLIQSPPKLGSTAILSTFQFEQKELIILGYFDGSIAGMQSDTLASGKGVYLQVFNFEKLETISKSLILSIFSGRLNQKVICKEDVNRHFYLQFSYVGVILFAKKYLFSWSPQYEEGVVMKFDMNGRVIWYARFSSKDSDVSMASMEINDSLQNKTLISGHFVGSELIVSVSYVHASSSIRTYELTCYSKQCSFVTLMDYLGNILSLNIMEEESLATLLFVEEQQKQSTFALMTLTNNFTTIVTRKVKAILLQNSSMLNFFILFAVIMGICCIITFVACIAYIISAVIYMVETDKVYKKQFKIPSLNFNSKNIENHKLGKEFDYVEYPATTKNENGEQFYYKVFKRVTEQKEFVRKYLECKRSEYLIEIRDVFRLPYFEMRKMFFFVTPLYTADFTESNIEQVGDSNKVLNKPVLKRKYHLTATLWLFKAVQVFHDNFCTHEDVKEFNFVFKLDSNNALIDVVAIDWVHPEGEIAKTAEEKDKSKLKDITDLFAMKFVKDTLISNGIFTTEEYPNNKPELTHVKIKRSTIFPTSANNFYAEISQQAELQEPLNTAAAAESAPQKKASPYILTFDSIPEIILLIEQKLKMEQVQIVKPTRENNTIFDQNTVENIFAEERKIFSNFVGWCLPLPMLQCIIIPVYCLLVWLPRFETLNEKENVKVAYDTCWKQFTRIWTKIFKCSLPSAPEKKLVGTSLYVAVFLAFIVSMLLLGLIGLVALVVGLGAGRWS